MNQRSLWYTIRVLGEADVGAFRDVRLRALRDHPDAFGEDADAFEQRSLDDLVKRFQDEPGRDKFILGGYINGVLCGTVGFVREAGSKTRHKGVIWGVYVAPEARSSGLARALMIEAIMRVRQLDGVEQIQLAVAASNIPARALYNSLGFERWGIERRALRLADRYVDEEHMVLHL